ncbi:MAG TPA: hypothetical protein PLG99_08240, partial [Kaistiaceae bacterium]|nr:hypothetical protein [Kaistiaceae bacterium]
FNGDTLLVLELRRWAADPNDVADPADAYTDANGYRHDGDPTTGLFIDHNGNGVFDYAVDEQVFETVTGDINASALTGAVLDRDEVDLGAPNRITGTIASLGLTEQTGGVGSEDVEIVNLAAVTDDDGVFHVMYDGTSGKFYAVQYDTVVQSDGTTRTYMIRGAEYSDPRIIAELTQYEMVVVGDGVADADQTRAMTVALNLTTGINDDSGITTDTASTVAGYDLNRGRFEITALEARYDNNIVDRYETVPTANRDGAVAGADGQGSRLFLINDSDPVAGYTGTGTAIDPRNAQYDVTSAGWIGLLPDTADADFRFNGDADGADNIDNVADVDFTASIDATPVADTFTGITGITAGNDAPARADGARPIRNNIVLWSEGLTGTLTINSLSTTGLGTNETETLVGHSMVVVSARAGDAGIGALGGLDEGVVEGNGGDVAIAQGDLGGDITAYAENLLTVNSTAITGLGLNYTYTRIGHERTIGLDADRHDDLTPGSKLLDEGSIVAGNGGTTDAEDYNTTAEAEGLATTSAHTVLGRLVAGRNVGAFADTTDVEDGDGGNVLITHGVLKGSDNLGNRESVILARNPDAGGFDTDIAIALDSHGAVLINTTGTLAGTGAAYSRITIGLQQHAVATAGDAGAGTAGDGGNVIVSRGAISGDIVAQALNGGAVTVANTPIAGVGAAFSDIQIGHESTFGYELEAINPLGLFATVTSGDGGAGADRYASVRDALVAFLLDEDNTESTNNDGQIEYVAGRVTLTDASKVVADIDNAYRMVEAANKLADRYAPEDQTRLANALAAIGAARTAAHAALENAGTTTLTLDEQVDAVQTAARTTLDAFAFMSATASDAASPIDGTTFTQADLDKIFGVTGFTDDRNDAYTAIEDLTNGEDRGNDGLVAATSAFYAENASKQLGDHADGGDIVYTSANALRDAVPAATIADEGKIAGNVRLVSGIDNESLHFNTAVDPNSGDPIQNLYGDNDALEATNDGSTAGDMLRAAGGTHVDRADYLLGTQDDYSSGLVSITSVATAAAAAAEADTEIGHRRLMWNASGAAG